MLVPLGQAQHRGNLRLHIGGEAGVGHGLDIGAGEVAGTGGPGWRPHPPRISTPISTSLAVMQSRCLGMTLLMQDLAAGGGHGGHIGARLDLVGDDGVEAAAELFHALGP